MGNAPNETCRSRPGSRMGVAPWTLRVQSQAQRWSANGCIPTQSAGAVTKPRHARAGGHPGRQKSCPSPLSDPTRVKR